MGFLSQIQLMYFSLLLFFPSNSAQQQQQQQQDIFSSPSIKLFNYLSNEKEASSSGVIPDSSVNVVQLQQQQQLKPQQQEQHQILPQPNSFQEQANQLLSITSSTSLLENSPNKNNINNNNNYNNLNNNNNNDNFNNNNNNLAEDECFARSCDQLISGRDLSYERALQIIQEEEYLTAADLNIIRKRRDVNKEPSTISTLVLAPFAVVLGVALLGAMLLLHPPPPSPPPSLASPPPSPPSLAFPPPSPPQTSSSFQSAREQQGNQRAPRGQPQPGTFGGGGIPLATSALAAEALSLVPAGLTAVAIFPPFAKPRRFNAVCVIFAEGELNLFNRRKRRQTSRQSSILGSLNQIWERLLRNWPNLNIVRNYRGSNYADDRQQYQYDHFQENYYQNYEHSRYGYGGHDQQQQQYGQQPQHDHHHQQQQQQSGYGQEQESIQRYGFRCRVRLVEQQRCAKGRTCDDFGQKIILGRRQLSGEEYSSEAPPDCRTEFIGCPARF